MAFVANPAANRDHGLSSLNGAVLNGNNKSVDLDELCKGKSLTEKSLLMNPGWDYDVFESYTASKMPDVIFVAAPSIPQKNMIAVAAEKVISMSESGKTTKDAFRKLSCFMADFSNAYGALQSAAKGFSEVLADLATSQN